jgi:hypothetical protein
VVTYAGKKIIDVGVAVTFGYLSGASPDQLGVMGAVAASTPGAAAINSSPQQLNRAFSSPAAGESMREPVRRTLSAFGKRKVKQDSTVEFDIKYLKSL